MAPGRQLLDVAVDPGAAEFGTVRAPRGIAGNGERRAPAASAGRLETDAQRAASTWSQGAFPAVGRNAEIRRVRSGETHATDRQRRRAAIADREALQGARGPGRLVAEIQAAGCEVDGRARPVPAHHV